MINYWTGVRANDFAVPADQDRAWLDPLGESLHAVSGPFPAWAQNAIHTVKALYIVVQRSVPHRTAVLDRLADLDWSGQRILPG